MMTIDQAKKLLTDAADKLGEHFSSVQIHASWMVEDESGVATGHTEGEHGGYGDWYARQALAQEFINQGKAAEIGRSVAQAIDDTNGGSGWKQEGRGI